MKNHEIIEAIAVGLNEEGRAYWNGIGSEGRNEALIYAQEHGIEAAIKEVELWAQPERESEVV